MKTLLLVLGFGLSTFFLPVVSHAENLDQWLDAQFTRVQGYMFDNIAPAGAARGSVVASPSTENPNYYYHWTRDAALTFREVVELMKLEDNPETKASYVRLIKDYVNFSRHNQLTNNLSGAADAEGVGEPKFNMDGSAYEEAWGRPQNDAPALRALTLTYFAEELLNEAGGEKYIRDKLYNSSLPANTVIKVDLEFIAKHWRDKCFDLWEEVKGYHFYTMLQQAQALVEGAWLARLLDDGGAASYYEAEADQIFEYLNEYWDDENLYFQATIASESNSKPSNLDSAVILGVLHSGRVQGEFSVLDVRVQRTALALEEEFESIYGINQKSQNASGDFLAPAIGRYPEDRYDGKTTTGYGNPWFITTHAFAEFYEKLADALKSQGELELDDLNTGFFQRFTYDTLYENTTIHKGDHAFDEVIKFLYSYSDAFLSRSRYHTPADGRQSEQMNRDNGYMQSAHDLTWSYASFLSAYRTRVFK